ncbi:class I SAM-dependent methyltransferase [Methylobacterium sp. C25]|uniref:class I SAM-dependent methyltransferase n=1 Tax=Methylobacterium sp. C25 TaxID=2721622 RepID=UPI001F307E30|nr:methyltransferase domain-containing protein [Methylobacterium sp. C25]MCE4225123.1 class I SAM-dependent methyltransferase [Methylobacterium sp. C25]
MSDGSETWVAPRSLRNCLGADEIVPRAEDAWTSLKPSLERVIAEAKVRRVLEIGGGRHPFFTVADSKRLGFDLTVNDLDAEELSHAPGEFGRLVLDIAADLDGSGVERGVYDLIFSRMVFEHVRDAEKAWSNVHTLLAPGGIGFAFVPTLFSPPFVINRAMPEALTSRVLRLIDRSRNPDEIPKFPAFYQACRASETALAPMLTRIGFREVCVVPFFGTPYFPAVPVLKHLASAFDRWVERRDWRIFASYAYIVARK